MIGRIQIVVALFCLSSSIYAQTYKCTDPKGKIYYQDSTCPSNATVEDLKVQTQIKVGRSEESRAISAPASDECVRQHMNAVDLCSRNRSKRLGECVREHLTPDCTKQVAKQSSSLSSMNESLPAAERLKSCNSSVAIAAAEEIINNPDSLKEPIMLFPAAAALFQNGKKDEAVFWFYAAQLRTRYQLAFEKGDRGQLLTIMMMTVGQAVNNYAMQNTSNLNRILDRVLEWDKITPNPFNDRTRSESIDKQIEQVYSGLRDLKSKIFSEKDDLERKARLAAPEIERTYAQSRDLLCRKGQPDPAYAKQTIQKEWSLVLDFVKNHKDVIREAGGVGEVSPAISRIQSQATLPDRYEVSVSGNKTIYAIVDVSRSAGDAKFTLACISHLSHGHREAFKDPCKQ